MNNIKNTIKKLSSDYYEEIVNIRREIHKKPELAFEEHQTADLIYKKLRSWGIDVQKGVAKTGLVALVKGNNPDKKVVALRADMDALPISETNDVEYKSVNSGIMHACGHDAHIASLLGTAKILQDLRNEYEGSIKLIFQPSEEKYPGGASVMIKEGVLENPKPATIFGQHVFPELEAGKIGVRSGKFMASTDEIYLTVKGKGGHGGIPHKNIDTVLIASHIIVGLQQIVSRVAPPNIPTVLSFGRIIGEGKTNIIPDEVKIEGTIRTFNEEWRAEAHKKIEYMANAIAESFGGSCEVFIDKGYPFVFNDELLTIRLKNYAREYLGEQNVVDIEMRMTAEDFALYGRHVPACFYRLGIANEAKGITSNLHSSTFNIDEKSLETGMGLMAWVAVNELSV
jgi:amidohydrolase